MTVAGLDLDLWSLLGTAGSLGLGLVGRVLKGWWGTLTVFLAGAALAGFVAWKIGGWQAAARERDRLQVEVITLTATNAANRAVHAAELADKDRAIAGLERVAAAAQQAAADLAATVDRLRRSYRTQGSDPELTPAGQDYFDTLRQEGSTP